MEDDPVHESCNENVVKLEEDCSNEECDNEEDGM